MGWKLYLDIDGVLLTTKNTRAADGAIELIDFALSNFECYWLTTHCKDGNCSQVVKMLDQYYPKDVAENLKKVKPAKWNTLKTEGIDFDSDFFWLDDYVFEAEKIVLERHSCLENLILVNLFNQDELSRVKQKIIEIGREKIFNKRYSTRIAWSNNFKDLKPIIGLIFEFASNVIEDGEKAFMFVKRIENDLYNRGIIPFKINSYNDIYKIDILPFSDIKRALWYIWLAVKHKEENWQWDEVDQCYKTKAEREGKGWGSEQLELLNKGGHLHGNE